MKATIGASVLAFLLGLLAGATANRYQVLNSGNHFVRYDRLTGKTWKIHTADTNWVVLW